MATLPGVEAGDGISRMPLSMLKRTIGENPYIPRNPWPVQLQFLELECRDALFGGSGGGGKSEALLMAALQFAHVPGYAALIVRRHFADLKLPGGLIDRSLEWLRGKAHWNAQENRWRFKSGATLQFGYTDREGDEQRYHGMEVQFVGLDEAVQFTETQIVFFFERLRRKVEIPVPLRVRLATTPGGPGHEFIRRRYIKPGTPGKVFVPATIRDNPAIDQEQYIESLGEVTPLRRAQILEGDWDAVEGGRFQALWLGHTWAVDPHDREQCVLAGGATDGERFAPAACPTFQTCDPAASTSAKADHFVLSTWKVTPKASVIWWDCQRHKLEIPEQVTVCQSSYRRHRPQFVAVEEVLNQRALAQLLRRSLSPVMVVRGVSPLGRDKLARAAGGINLAASGRLYLPERHPTFPIDDVRGELVRFTGQTDDEASDCVDTLSYACELLPTVRAGGSEGRRSAGLWTPKQSAWSGLR